MRLSLATTIVLGVILIGFATSRTSAQGENLQGAIVQGEKLSIGFDPVGVGVDCTVIGVRGDFVGCQADPRYPGRKERWYNLRLVSWLERPGRQQ